MYYGYRITNLSTGRIYIGVSTKDEYVGSGKALWEDYRRTFNNPKLKFDLQTSHRYVLQHMEGLYTKEILDVFNNEHDMYIWEALNVTWEEVSNPLFFNLIPGGNGGWKHVHNDPELQRKAILASKTPEAEAKRKKTCLENGVWENMKMHSPESHQKSVETLRALGKYEQMAEAMHTPEANARRLEAMKDNGTYSKTLDNLQSQENRAKASASKIANRHVFRLPDGELRMVSYWRSMSEKYPDWIDLGLFTELDPDQVKLITNLNDYLVRE